MKIQVLQTRTPMTKCLENIRTVCYLAEAQALCKTEMPLSHYILWWGGRIRPTPNPQHRPAPFIYHTTHFVV